MELMRQKIKAAQANNKMQTAFKQAHIYHQKIMPSVIYYFED